MGLFSKHEKRWHPSNPDRWFLGQANGLETTSGARVNEETALSWTALSTGIRALCDDIASIPLNVYKRLEGGGKEIDRSHQLFPVLHDSPNEEMTSFEWRSVTQAHIIGWGNAYSEIIRNQRGRIIELWPINPDRVKLQRNKRKKIVYRITLPRDETGGVAGHVMMRRDQILHIKGFSINGLFGRSLIQDHREAIGLGLATEEFAARFFGQGASPTGILEHPATISEDAQERLKNAYDNEYSGLTRAHRIMLLEEGMKWHQVTVDPEKAQFLGLRQFQVTEAARILKMPPHKVGDLERQTFTNIEHLGIDYLVHTLRPWLVNWEQRMRKSLLAPGDTKTVIEFVVEGLLRGDSITRAKFYQSLFNMASISPNEIREKENMNPFEGGDKRYIQLNLVDVTDENVDIQARRWLFDRLENREELEHVG